MNDAHPEGVVVDTMVISWLFDDRPNPRAERYRALIGPVPVLLAFHTVMELRFGAIRAGWGELRRRRLERRIAELAVVQPDDAMITVCATLRADCQQIGHALGHKLHDGCNITAREDHEHEGYLLERGGPGGEPWSPLWYSGGVRRAGFFPAGRQIGRLLGVSFARRR